MNTEYNKWYSKYINTIIEAMLLKMSEKNTKTNFILCGSARQSTFITSTHMYVVHCSINRGESSLESCQCMQPHLTVTSRMTQGRAGVRHRQRTTTDTVEGRRISGSSPHSALMGHHRYAACQSMAVTHTVGVWGHLMSLCSTRG